MQTPNFFQNPPKGRLRRMAHGSKLRCPSRAATSRRRATWSFRHACQLGLEGIVSKRLGSRYTSGRSRDWLKFKNPAAPNICWSPPIGPCTPMGRATGPLPRSSCRAGAVLFLAMTATTPRLNRFTAA
jgi:hypothetical protein